MLLLLRNCAIFPPNLTSLTLRNTDFQGDLSHLIHLKKLDLTRTRRDDLSTFIQFLKNLE